MAHSPSLDRLQQLFGPSLREVEILGQWASPQAWEDRNTYERLIALDGLPRERQQRIRRAGWRCVWGWLGLVGLVPSEMAHG